MTTPSNREISREITKHLFGEWGSPEDCDYLESMLNEAEQRGFERGIKKSAKIIEPFDDISCKCERCNLSAKILDLLDKK